MTMSDVMMDSYDVVAIGGGPAGLNGALMLGRARRSVLVIDAGAPRNAPAAGVHGLLGREGISPGELLEQGRAEVRAYGGHIVTGEVASVARNRDGFSVMLANGESVHARRLLMATGLVDELPDILGLRERWGRDVIHCPYCHGWEVRDQAIGVLGLGPMSVHQALMFRQLSARVTYFCHTAPPNDEQAEQLAARGIRVVDGKVVSLQIVDDRLTGLELADGTVVELDALTVSPRMVARAGPFVDLGLGLEDHPSGMGQHIPTDSTGRTEVPGVWAAGNATDPMAQVGSSAAAGAFAGAQINADLIAEEIQRAVEEHRRVAATAP
jgi:thioredoxin reductase